VVSPVKKVLRALEIDHLEMLQPAPEGAGCIRRSVKRAWLLLLRRLLRGFLLSACFLLCGHSRSPPS